MYYSCSYDKYVHKLNSYYQLQLRQYNIFDFFLKTGWRLPGNMATHLFKSMRAPTYYILTLNARNGTVTLFR